MFQVDSEYFIDPGNETFDGQRDGDGLLIVKDTTSVEMAALLRQYPGSAMDQKKEVIEIETKGVRPISLRL